MGGVNKEFTAKYSALIDDWYPVLGHNFDFSISPKIDASLSQFIFPRTHSEFF